MIDRQAFYQVCQTYGFSLTEQQLKQFDLYAALLVEWNQKINLTAITAPEEIMVKHFLDSLLLLDAVELPEGAHLLDVGAGAGFPSGPIRIIRPDLQIAMLDSLQKRIRFLETLEKEIDVRLNPIHARAEEAGHQAAFRERFDLATARAVARLHLLCEYCLPFVKIGGLFAALKGGDVEQEVEEGKRAIHELGAQLEKIEKYALPDGSQRSIVVIKKISQTPTKYPRNPGKIAKMPLI